MAFILKKNSLNHTSWTKILYSISYFEKSFYMQSLPTVGARKIDTLRNKEKQFFFIALLYFFSIYAYNIENAYI